LTRQGNRLSALRGCFSLRTHCRNPCPHFYLDYYVFSYATSFAAAVHIAENIKIKNVPAVESFMEFLSAGTSDCPIEVLKKAAWI